ncbi:hypothetical protein SADUNF_Sadunf07G0057500 [Salix dunnii]|uniref:Uncharacterized protein n=1 Tax=Salix dunnii TaxID=1413687 RepID=A0A835K097_9ROSI|nr:hypothetical protein SADUNF_Sadunf07G0057500 [Salix dunnii]
MVIKCTPMEEPEICHLELKALELLHSICDLVRIFFYTLTIYSCCINLTLVLILFAPLSFQVVTAPMSSVNVIAVEAFKKYILFSKLMRFLVKYSSSLAWMRILDKSKMGRYMQQSTRKMDPEQYKNYEMIERIDSSIQRYIGHLKERTLKNQMAKDPIERSETKDFANSEHPFSDRPLEPNVMPPQKVREMRPHARRAMIRAQKKADQQKQGGNDKREAKREKLKQN